jgi:peptidyl-prolyl cis-trans isomerase SurA
MRPAYLLVFLLVVMAGAQQVVDRMVAVVNRRVILESELEQEARVEQLLEGKPASGERTSAQALESVLDRLIDRLLLEQQIAQSAPLDPSASELAEQIKEIRSKIPAAATDAGWKAVLASYGLTQIDLEVHVISEFRVLRYVDLHFRGLVNVDRADIQTYYLETLLPALERRGATVPPLAEVSPKIEKILVEQRMDEMLNDWLQTLRAQAHIEKLMSPGASLAHGDKP